jgi:hypothetical protein
MLVAERTFGMADHENTPPTKTWKQRPQGAGIVAILSALLTPTYFGVGAAIADQWYIVREREGCIDATAKGISPKTVMDAVRKQGYSCEVTDSGGDKPDVVMLRSDAPLMKETGGGMVFARSLSTCEKLRAFTKGVDQLEEDKYR